MRRGVIAGMIFAWKGIFFPCYMVEAKASPRLLVCPTCEIQSIARALDIAPEGSEILVRKGTYAEGPLVVSRPVRLLGEGWPVVDGRGVGHVFLVRSDGVSIRGFFIIGSGLSGVEEMAGIRAEQVADCEFSGNYLVLNTYALYLAHSERCLIHANFILGESKGQVSGGNGVHLWYSRNIEISKNTVMGHRDGLYFEFSDDMLIENNRSENNIRYGMHFMFSHRNKFRHNVFRSNQTGVAVMYSKSIEMSDNRFERNWGDAFYGMLLKEISDSRVERNWIEGNTTGILLDSSNRNKFIQNTLLGNGWAFEITGGALENEIRGNDFIRNHFDVTTSSRSDANRFDGNFWDTYEGYDLDRDGRGDIPHRPISVFTRWVARYPELAVLLNSPVIRFLETAERVFPGLTPRTMLDRAPAMYPIARSQKEYRRAEPFASQ